MKRSKSIAPANTSRQTQIEDLNNIAEYRKQIRKIRSECYRSALKRMCENAEKLEAQRNKRLQGIINSINDDIANAVKFIDKSNDCYSSLSQIATEDENVSRDALLKAIKERLRKVHAVFVSEFEICEYSFIEAMETAGKAAKLNVVAEQDGHQSDLVKALQQEILEKAMRLKEQEAKCAARLQQSLQKEANLRNAISSLREKLELADKQLKKYLENEEEERLNKDISKLREEVEQIYEKMKGN